MSSGNVVEIGVRFKMDGSGFVGQMQGMRGELAGMATANQAAAASAGALTSATAATAAANDELVQAFRQSNAALQTAMQAIIANTAATNQGIGALAAAADASRERADASNAQAAAERIAAAAANDNAAALRKAATDAQQYASMAAQLRSAIDPMYAAQQRFNQQLDAAEMLLEKSVITEREYASAVALARKELQDHAKAVAGNGSELENASGKSRQAQAAYINLGRQMQDVAVMASMPGVNLGTIITTQGGQIADAASQMGGRFAGLASFLAGPWGAAVIVGAGLLVNFAEAMFKAGDAAEDELAKLKKNAAETEIARKAKEAFGKSEEGVREAILDQAAALDKQIKSLKSAAAQALDLANQNYNAELKIRNATKAMLEQAIAQEAIANKTLSSGGDGTEGSADAAFGYAQGASKRVDFLKDLLARQNDMLGKAAANRTQAQSIYDVEEGRKAADTAETIKRKYEGLSELARKRAVAEGWVGDRLQQQVKAYAEQEKAEIEAERKRSRTRKTKDNSASVVKFDDDIAGQIAKIANEYAELPTAVQKANADLLTLAAKSREIKQKAAGKNGDLVDVKGLNAQIDAAIASINNSLTKPFRDYVQAQADQASINKLILAGRQDEAEALRVILDLQKKQIPVSEDEAAQILEIVRANQLNARVLRDQQALIQANVAAATNMRAALNQTVADTLKGRGSFDNILSSIGNSYINIMSGRIVESIFGDSLRAFEDEATRNFRAATETSGNAILRLGDAADAAARRIGGGNAGTPVGLSGADPVAQLFDSVLGKKASNDNGVPVTTGPDIVATGSRSRSNDVSGVASPMFGLLNNIIKGFFGPSLGKTMVEGVAPVFKKLETLLPEAVRGGFTGAVASRLVNGDGAGSTIGGTIGGAIGAEMGKKFLPAGLEAISRGLGSSLGSFAGPLGSIVGGVVGGMLGDLFTTTKAGTTVITGANKASTTGSTQEVSAGLTNMGNSITSTLESVASKFNTSVGDFSVSIGQYKDYFRVSASGSSHVGDKYYPNSAGADILYDGTDQATATLIAIQNAIADGAIKGLSKAVQKAMSSSSNIESALREALKVQEVELAIGGIGAQLQKSFREEEQTAAERLRIARQYGFDMVATEKTNAEARAALTKKLLDDQVGSLQQILDEMSSGQLFEGSAVDQRAAILAKITSAKADVAAGKDGASDTLAKLLEQLNTVSKEAFGTTAQYQADRALITDVARDAVELANKRISDAQAMTTAQAQTNAALDENNDQNSEVIALLKDAYAQGAISNALLSQIAANLGNSSALAALAKTS